MVTALFFVTRALDFTTSAASTVQPVAMGLKSCQKTSRPYSFVPALAVVLVVERGKRRVLDPLVVALRRLGDRRRLHATDLTVRLMLRRQRAVAHGPARFSKLLVVKELKPELVSRRASVIRTSFRPTRPVPKATGTTWSRTTSRGVTLARAIRKERGSRSRVTPRHASWRTYSKSTGRPLMPCFGAPIQFAICLGSKMGFCIRLWT